MSNNKNKHLDREYASTQHSNSPEPTLPFTWGSSDTPATPDVPPVGAVAPLPNGADPSPSNTATSANGNPPEPNAELFDMEAIIQAKRDRRREEDSQTVDPFDPARLRLSQDFASAVGIRKPLVCVPVRKPSKESFVRTHPDESYRLQTLVLELKADREVYLVAPELWVELAAEPTVSPRLLVLTVDRQGIAFLWPIRLPGPDGKIDDWSRTALEASRMAQTEWVRLSANMALGAYDIAVATFHAEPAWPNLSFHEILKIAFRDRVISSWDHPVLRRLRGEI